MVLSKSIRLQCTNNFGCQFVFVGDKKFNNIVLNFRKFVLPIRWTTILSFFFFVGPYSPPPFPFDPGPVLRTLAQSTFVTLARTALSCPKCLRTKRTKLTRQTSVFDRFEGISVVCTCTVTVNVIFRDKICDVRAARAQWPSFRLL